MRLSILDRSQREVVSLVRSRDVDFGLVLESWAPPDLAVLRWQEVEMVLMTPPGHPLTLLSRVTLVDIAPYPLILPPRGHAPRRQTLEALFHKQGLPLPGGHGVLQRRVELPFTWNWGWACPRHHRQGPALRRERSLAFVPLGHYVPPDFIAVILRKDKTPERPPPGLSGPVAVAVTSGGKLAWPVAHP